MGDCSRLGYPETMKRLTISLALLLANGLGTAEANGTEIPSEVREAFSSYKMPEVQAFQAMEKAVTKAGKAIEGFVPLPDLTVDLKGRRLSKHLLGSDLGGRGRFDLKADYTLGGTPVTKLSMHGRGVALQASYTVDGKLQTSVSCSLTAHQSIQVAISNANREDHRASWTFSLPL